MSADFDRSGVAVRGEAGKTRAMTQRHTPPAGYHTITPRIVADDVAGLEQFLRDTFGAVGEVPAGEPAQLQIGDSLVMISATGERDVFPAFLYVYVDDADGVYERAIAAGAATIEAPLDTPYGDRRAMVRDPHGNVFQIAHRLEP
jgi:PhnB protein